MKTRLGKAHVILLALIAGNLAIVLLFPPCDYVSIAQRTLPTFDGFHFLLDLPDNRRINSSFLALEVIVVLINGCLGWLLLKRTGTAEGGSRLSRWLIGFLILNLTLIMLFPPFSDYRMLSRDLMPSFEGFYFVFADNSQRHLADEVLFLEITMLLANAALIWLIVREGDLQKKMLAGPPPGRMQNGKKHW